MDKTDDQSKEEVLQRIDLELCLLWPMLLRDFSPERFPVMGLVTIYLESKQREAVLSGWEDSGKSVGLPEWLEIGEYNLREDHRE